MFYSGFGIEFSTVYHRNISDKTSLYSGGGVLWGKVIIEQSSNEAFVDKIGLLGYFGYSRLLNKGFRLNLEVNPMYLFNIHNPQNTLMLSPNISLAYTFKYISPFRKLFKGKSS